MRIFLVRHGESEGNVIHQINDDPQRIVNLTARGRSQAERASDRLRLVHFTHAYVSEFPRARQTAAILLHHHDLPLQIDARLNERRSGMDGMPVNSFNDLLCDDPLGFKPVHGESFLEEMERLRGFLDDISTRHPQGVALAVSHENPIIAALSLTVGDPNKTVHRSLDNCEWVELDWMK